MRFLFDCEDAVALPAAYKLVDDIKPFIDRIKAVEVDDAEAESTEGKLAAFKRIMHILMVECPAETGALLAQLWVLEEIDTIVTDEDGEVVLDEDGAPIVRREMEKAPNAFKTMGALFSNEVAIDFFTSVMPSLLQISKEISPLLK